MTLLCTFSYQSSLCTFTRKNWSASGSKNLQNDLTKIRLCWISGSLIDKYRILWADTNAEILYTNMRMSSWLLYRVARKASRFKMNKQVFQNMRTTTDYVLVNKLLIMNRFTTVSLLESRLKDCELNFVTRIIYAESSILDGCSHSKHNNSTINDARMVRFMKCENNFYKQSFSSSFHIWYNEFNSDKTAFSIIRHLACAYKQWTKDYLREKTLM